jgi:hypothetical protein
MLVASDLKTRVSKGTSDALQESDVGEREKDEEMKLKSSCKKHETTIIAKDSNPTGRATSLTFGGFSR